MNAGVAAVLDGSARWALIHSDCVEMLRTLPDESADALVTDPPAGIGFMGKAWDSDKGGRLQWIAWLAGVLRESLRCLKPGAHALIWALPRTSHWTGMAIEEAGFEVRDRLSHFFGTGFPKSLNFPGGIGTALKPACEDWWLARKPLAGTVAANVAAHRTGGLNIDACRIAATDTWAPARHGARMNLAKGSEADRVTEQNPAGRWPANVILDEDAAAELDAQSGECRSSGHVNRSDSKTVRGEVQFTSGKGFAIPGINTYSDSGGASRFFYCAKTSRAERDFGCEGLPLKSGGEMTDREEDSAGTQSPRAGAGRGEGARNFHPTVKPQALMRWLCRLITPPGGLVLDLFTGSGSTGVAALSEGLRFIGAELDPDYLPIGRARLTKARPQKRERAPAKPPPARRVPTQTTLFPESA